MPRNSRFGLDGQGYFTQNGQRVIPFGVNYWPGSTGVELWPRFPATEIQHDLDVLAKVGMNCVRFFLRWQDFEPGIGQYDETMFGRLGQVLGWCRERKIYAHPSLFVGFLSGGLFWPEWKAGRNLFADAYMRERATAFARKAAGVMAEFKDIVIAIDQGNEMCCLAESREAEPAAVASWCGDVNAAVRSVWPEALMISGNEQAQFLGDSGWRFGDLPGLGQPGCNLYSMHAYPVAAWHAVRFDGLTDRFCQSLLPMYTKVARAFGPVMVQEFGTIVTFGARQQRAYLEGILPKCWDAGANGFLWWCMRDITANVYPYTGHGFEGTLGLFDAQDRVKPGLEYYLEFGQSLATRPAPSLAADTIGLYFPRQWYNRNVPGAVNTPGQMNKHLVMANYLLESLGRSTTIVRGDRPLPAHIKTIIIPGVFMNLPDTAALDAWVRAGGRLIWNGPDPVNWGPAYIEMLGARPVDYRATLPAEIEAGGKTWQLRHYPRDMRVELEMTTATVLARDSKTALPAVLRNALGKGTVVTCLNQVERTLADLGEHREVRDGWAAFYAWLLESVAGI